MPTPYAFKASKAQRIGRPWRQDIARYKDIGFLLTVAQTLAE
jgi:hypothetical protein